VDKCEPSEEDLTDSDLRRVLRYWQSLRSERGIPSRSDIDPLDIPYILGRLSLIEVVGVPPRFRWRLAGSWFRERFGKEATGMMVEDWPDVDQRELLLHTYRRVVADRAPYLRVREITVERERFRYEAIILPLSQDGQTVSMIMSAVASGPSMPARER
jgi:hypothetical protein